MAADAGAAGPLALRVALSAWHAAGEGQGAKTLRCTQRGWVWVLYSVLAATAPIAQYDTAEKLSPLLHSPRMAT